MSREIHSGDDTETVELNSTSCGCSPTTLSSAAEESPTAPRLEQDFIGAGRTQHTIEQAAIPGGSFIMGDSSGDANPFDGETPQHSVRLAAFSIDTTTVTNRQFAKFVAATGYVTDAERLGFSAVFHAAVQADTRDILSKASDTPWWLGVHGANWTHPGGNNSSIDGLDDHPVVHISWHDANAYCQWAGRRLPTEAEWEYASRGGLNEKKYPWGDEEVSAETWRANIWQGRFPTINTLDDGYLTTAPVETYSPNNYGLWQTVGNVWEWCSDWFSAKYYASSPELQPQGPAHGTERVLRGGSFLCHLSYCNRYRNSARSRNTPDSCMSNAGFRTVAL